MQELSLWLSCWRSQLGVQDLRDLRDKIKTKMAAALTELRNMQMLEDLLEKAQVRKGIGKGL